MFVLSRLFRRLMLEKLTVAHAGGKLTFFGSHTHLTDADRFAAFLAPLRKTKWFVYAKRPFAGPTAVLAYLSRYTHRVAISNSRLISCEAGRVTFKVKNYRAEGEARYTTMSLQASEFIRRLLIHVLPTGFHRIRHYGFLASGGKAGNLAKARELLAMPEPAATEAAADAVPTRTCPCCGGPMHVIEFFEPGQAPRHRASPRPMVIRIDTS